MKRLLLYVIIILALLALLRNQDFVIAVVSELGGLASDMIGSLQPKP